jgi:CubicO group peptidase (beta-lactamase class C family)
MITSALGRRAFLAAGGAALLAGRAGRPAIAEPVPLAADLESLRLRHGLPGIAGLVLRGGAVAAQGAAGVRSVTGQDPIQLTDPFVIGSCGKSMTATVVARLVARGALRFETTLQEAFPDLVPRMQPAYRGVSVAALLAHRGGIPAVPPVPLPLAGDPVVERARALPTVLALPPQGVPGQTFLYSNLGYALVGAMLDRLTGTPFEALTAVELFQPLGLASAGFLAPAAPEAPRGHTAFGLPLPPDSPLYPPPAASPAGLHHVALPDWATCAAVHLGLGPEGYLPLELLARLHTPWDPLAVDGYALGWHVAPGPSGATTLRHDGSDGYWSARIVLIPALEHAILMAANILGPNSELAADELEALLLARFPPA